jgi:hypothetical protein
VRARHVSWPGSRPGGFLDVAFARVFYLIRVHAETVLVVLPGNLQVWAYLEARNRVRVLGIGGH